MPKNPLAEHSEALSFRFICHKALPDVVKAWFDDRTADHEFIAKLRLIRSQEEARFSEKLQAETASLARMPEPDEHEQGIPA